MPEYEAGVGSGNSHPRPSGKEKKNMEEKEWLRRDGVFDAQWKIPALRKQALANHLLDHIQHIEEVAGTSLEGYFFVVTFSKNEDGSIPSGACAKNISTPIIFRYLLERAKRQ